LLRCCSSLRAVAFLAAASIFAILAPPVSAQYPEIDSLTRDDPLFLQHEQGIAEYYRRASREEELPPLLIYRYAREDHETLFGIAARFSLPYSAVATLNRLSEPDLGSLHELLIPSLPGIFVPVVPESDLELVMADLRRDTDALLVTVRRPESTRFRFFPGEDFLPEERIGFLSVLFRHPLPNGDLTSGFGMRTSPITGQWTFHGGVDYAAPAGTSVLAARSGRVVEVGEDPALGTYIVVRHAGGFETVYGHLQSVAVSLNQNVRSGMMLGAVGSTGLVTGPHLHFEIRQSGQSRDPETMLR
jgi:hypothetical protein